MQAHVVDTRTSALQKKTVHIMLFVRTVYTESAAQEPNTRNGGTRGRTLTDAEVHGFSGEGGGRTHCWCVQHTTRENVGKCVVRMRIPWRWICVVVRFFKYIYF